MGVRFTFPFLCGVLVLLLFVGQTTGELLSPQEDESLGGPGAETKSRDGGALPLLGQPVAMRDDSYEAERRDIERVKKYILQVDQRDYRKGKVYALNRGDDIKVLPVVQCHGGKTDLLLAEDFSCSDAVQRRDGKEVKVYANKGNAYAALTLDFSDALQKAPRFAQLVLSHAAEQPWMQKFSVYAYDDVWKPVCTQLTAERTLMDLSCDLSAFVATHPQKLIVRVEGYAKGPAVWTVESAYLRTNSADSPIPADQIPRSIQSLPPPSGGLKTTLPEGETNPPTPPAGGGGGPPGSTTRDGAADLTDGPLLSLQPSFAATPLANEFGAPSELSSREQTGVSPESSDGIPSITGAATGLLGQGDVIVGTGFVLLLVLLGLGFYGRGYGHWLQRHLGGKAL